MPSIAQLKYLVAVEQQRHFGKAAKACFVSQPSLSLQIQKVEEEFGFLIFDRRRKPISPTPRGVIILEEARQVLSAHNRMIERAKYEKGTIQGSFRLAIIPTILPSLIPYFLDEFCRTYLNVQLIIEERTTEACLLGLREESIDAAILATPLKQRGIREKVLYYEEFVFFAHAEHRELRNPIIDSVQLSSDGLWLLQDGHCLRNQIVSFCSVEDHGSLYPNLSFEGNSLESLRLLIQRGGGYTLFPQLYVQSMSDAERNTHVRRFQPPVPVREVGLVYRSQQWKTDIIEVIFQTIVRCIPGSVFQKKYGDVLGI